MRGFDDMRGSVNNDFMPKLLESQAFSLFIQDNGPPYRKLHKFDEVCSREYIPSLVYYVQKSVVYSSQLTKLAAAHLGLKYGKVCMTMYTISG